MLTLTRKKGEGILIEIPSVTREVRHIKIKALGLNGADMKIGIDAPPSYKISRIPAEKAPYKQLDLFED